ncbi:MAG TPA: N-acetyltransferase [Elusimicrobiota bacterium]|jgi:amino-acid N-acetyltransferase|nr:N-acetyltransferase [Elusimicrobiota bacterium]HNI57947.1 N-acetyltransferase [Elusimicrobiota bacterium]
MASVITIRRAKIGDVRAMHKLLSVFAEKKELLPRAISELYENLQQFHVADDKGRVVGCCSLAVQWDNLAEVKALAVDPDFQGRGIGRKLLDACLKDAKTLGITRVFALTMKDGFFDKIGFSRVGKNDLPHKVWTECVRCPYFPDACVEIAMVKDLGGVAPVPLFKAGDLPADGTTPTEPEGFPAARRARAGKKRSGS